MDLNPVERLIEWFRSLFDPKVNWYAIPKSGIVYSDYPREDNGYAKGWVASRSHFVVCAHANIAVGSKVHVWVGTEKIERTVLSLERLVLAVMLGRTGHPQDIYGGSDITVCKVDEPWPDAVHVFSIATTFKEKQQAATFHQDKTFSLRRLHNESKNSAWVRGTYYTRDLIPGDSGLPWIVFEAGMFKVVSHTMRTIWGEGPDYSDPVIKAPILRAMRTLGYHNIPT